MVCANAFANLFSAFAKPTFQSRQSPCKLFKSDAFKNVLVFCFYFKTLSRLLRKLFSEKCGRCTFHVQPSDPSTLQTHVLHSTRNSNGKPLLLALCHLTAKLQTSRRTARKKQTAFELRAHEN